VHQYSWKPTGDHHGVITLNEGFPKFQRGLREYFAARCEDTIDE
jgi:hypothetical protein